MMKRLFFLIPVFLLFASLSFAQYPINYETLCAQGSVPVSGPSGSTYDGATGKYRAIICVDPFGNVTFSNFTSNSWSTVIDAKLYGVYADARYTPAAVFNSTTTVTTLSNEHPFQCPNNVFPCNTPSAGSDVGSLVACSNMSAVQYSYINGSICPAGTTIVSVQSAHQITLSNAATATCTSVYNTASCQFVWGLHDDTAALNAAFAAATTTRAGLPPNCGALLLPEGNMFASSAISNASANCISVLTPGTIGYAVYGVGLSQSNIIPLPSFNANSCTVSNGCFFTVPGIGATQGGQYFHDFSINGAGMGAVPNGNGKSLLVLGAESLIENVALYEFGLNTGGFKGITDTGVAGGPSTMVNVINYAGGNQPCDLEIYVITFNLQCFGPTTIGSSPGSTINTNNSYFYTAATGGNVVTVPSAGSSWNSTNDQLQSGNTVAVINNSGGTIDLINDAISITGPGITNSAGSKLAMRNTSIVTGGSGVAVNNAGTVYDLGFNSFTGTITNTGNWFMSESVTGTASAVGNWTLTSGWGTSSISSAFGDSHRTRLTIAGAAGSAGPVLTWVFPTPFWVIPTSCTIIQNGGTSFNLTSAAISALSTTGVTFTFIGQTPTAQTYVFDASCGP
jgi:hypothetical protein